MLRFACALVACAATAGAMVAGCASGDNGNDDWEPDAAFDGVPPPPEGGSDTGGGRHDGGDAGAGDATTAQGGATGSALAAGATVSKSPSYSMFWTLGQGPGGNDTSHSPHFQIRGGVVGATQKP
jgi:hypothetical protein